MSLLPVIESNDDLAAVYRDDEVWAPAARAVAERHGIGARSWRRASDGSQIVLLSDDVILKFYVPIWPDRVAAETAALQLVEGNLGVETPRVVAGGELEGWDYLAMSRVAGVPLRGVEDELTLTDLERLAAELGELLAHLHDLRPSSEGAIAAAVPDWEVFLTTHFEEHAARERQRHTPGEWVEKLTAHLSDWSYAARPDGVFVHADLTHDHILVERVDNRWRIASLIDFGDVKIGDPAYEFAAPFASWTARRPTVRGAMLRGYGQPATDDYLGRVFESILLHEFASLGVLDLQGLSTIDGVRDRYVMLSPSPGR